MAIEEIFDIEKFNPYHDERGRFTTGSGAASFTIRTKDPSKQHLVDRAIERERKRHAESNSRLTPPKVAGVERGEPMTHEQADESRSNPLYLKDRKYRENCQSCVVAYEMRRRGYDVEAVEWDERNNLLQRKLAEDQRNGWTNEDGSPAMYEGRQKMSEVRDNWGKKVAETLTPKRAKAEIESLIGEGRYVIEYATKGMQTSGHIVMAERVGGKVRVFDPQSGKESSLEDEIKNHMKLQASRARGGVKYNVHPKVMRVDNKVLKSDYGNEVLRKRTTPKKSDSNVERKEMLGRMFRRDPNMGWVLDD